MVRASKFDVYMSVIKNRRETEKKTRFTQITEDQEDGSLHLCLASSHTLSPSY